MSTEVEAVRGPSAGGPARASRLGQLLSFPVVIAAAFATLVYRLTPASIVDPDIWWHLRNAESLFQSHRFIVKDTYSFTAFGAPWIDHEWLAELPFYLGWRAMGERGVLLVTALLIEAVMLGVFYLAYRRSGSIKATALVSVIAALFATISFGPRTLLFGWLCLVVELIVLERFLSGENSSRAIWALPPLFALWANLHGSWLIGMAVLVFFIACGCVRVSVGAIENAAWAPAQMRKLIAAACLSACALFANPYGWRLVTYPFNLAFHQQINIANVDEWRPLDLHSLRGRVFLLCLTALFLLQLVRQRRWALYELAFLFIGLYSAMSYSRFLFLAAILAMPLMAVGIPGLAPSRPSRNRPLLNALLLLALIPFATYRLPAARDDQAAALFPVQALPCLRTFRPQGSVFNEYLWGGFLEWNARQIPVMIDSRADIFEYNGTFKDYLDAVQLRRTNEILGKYKIRYVLFEREAPLVLFLLQTPSWKVDYEDGTTILLERTAALSDGI
jgi:hypothetical protein